MLVAEMLYVLAKLANDETDDDPAAVQPVDQETVRTKVRSLGKVLKMYTVLRQERETLVKLRGLNGTGLLPRGVLQHSDKLKEGMCFLLIIIIVMIEDATLISSLICNSAGRLPEGEAGR